jgi:hypothetical protein
MNWEHFEKIIYSSGDVFLPEGLKNALAVDLVGSSKKTFYLQGWSFVHFLSGILFGHIYLYLYPNVKTSTYYYKLFILHTIWELWQMLIGMSRPYNLTGSSNIVDTFVDTALFMLGAYVYRLV